MVINRKQEASFHGVNESKRLANCLLKRHIMKLVFARTIRKVICIKNVLS